jgi:hypothetical protein
MHAPKQLQHQDLVKLVVSPRFWVGPSGMVVGELQVPASVPVLGVTTVRECYSHRLTAIALW